MDFSIPEATLELGEAVYSFAKDRLNTGLDARYKGGARDMSDWLPLWQDCASEGLLGLVVDEQYGGSGLDTATAVHVLHEFGRGCSDNGLSLGLNAQIWPMQMPLAEFGTRAQKEAYLPGLLNGSIVFAHAITEAETGSNAMAMQTNVREVSGGYVLNGEKILVGMAPHCDLAMVFATSDPSKGAWGLDAFLVETRWDGVTREQQRDKMGLRTHAIGSLKFEDVHVPVEARLGPQGIGSSIFGRSLEWERSFIFASHVGAMKRQLDMCTSFAGERDLGQGPIDRHQSVGNRLADMRLRYETSNLLLRKGAWLADQGKNDALAASMTKLHVSEAYVANSMDAYRIFGGAAYMEDHPIARDLRDALGGVIYGGTSDIQRNLIAQLGKQLG